MNSHHLLRRIRHNAKINPEVMTPTHATKRGTRYRYYVSRSLLAGKAKDLGQRIPAAALEALVTHRIRDWLADPAGVFQAVQDVTG